MTSNIIRFKHRDTSIPIFEVRIQPNATVSDLRALVLERLAKEDHCLMRIFTRWYTKMAFSGGHLRDVELTDADGNQSLRDLGIDDYSEVQLEGPLTGDFESVGQAVAVLDIRVREQASQTNALLQQIIASQKRASEDLDVLKDKIDDTAVGVARANAAISELRSTVVETKLAVAELQGGQKTASDSLAVITTDVMATKAAVTDPQTGAMKAITEVKADVTQLQAGQKTASDSLAVITTELTNGSSVLKAINAQATELIVATRRAEVVNCQPQIAFDQRARQLHLLSEDWQNSLPKFTIDSTTPHPGVDIPDIYTVHNTRDEYVTIRSRMPLTLTNHRWAVRVLQNRGSVGLGLLPKLSPTQVLGMHGSWVGDNTLGGWSIFNNGQTYGKDWECGSISFNTGDLVCFDFNFANKKLTVSCGNRTVTGAIPIRNPFEEELYPAFYFRNKGEKACFASF